MESGSISIKPLYENVLGVTNWENNWTLVGNPFKNRTSIWNRYKLR